MGLGCLGFGCFLGFGLGAFEKAISGLWAFVTVFGFRVLGLLRAQELYATPSTLSPKPPENRVTSGDSWLEDGVPLYSAS